MRHILLQAVCAMCLWIFSIPSFAAPAAKTNFNDTVAAIQQQGQQLIDQYTPEQADAALIGFYNLYYNQYESSGMENAVAALSPKTNTTTEGLFAKLSGLASHHASKTELTQTFTELRTQLDRNLLLLSKNSKNEKWEAGLQSFVILLREGFEAMLIVTALLTYLRRSGHIDKARIIYRGVVLALIASFATAYAFSRIFVQAGAHREALEGITMLAAAAILSYVSYWLISKRQAADWQNYLKHKLNHALTTGSLFTLGLAAFLAVYREGAETILFYEALSGLYQNQIAAISVGIVAAIVALIALYWIMQKATLKIPYGLFFGATALFLYYMAFIFVGGGIRELQEAALLPITPVSGIPEITWLGIYPSSQSLMAQLAFLVPTVLGMIWWLRRGQPKKVHS